MHSTPDPFHVVFTGPLRPFAFGFAAELTRLGYAATSATVQLQLAAQLSRWLESQHLGLGDLTEPVMDRFLAVRRASHVNLYSVQALGPVLGYLRERCVVPSPVAPVPSSPAEVLLASYRQHLRDERCLSGPVVEAYAHWVTPFIVLRFDLDDLGFARLTAQDVAEFLIEHLPTLTRKTAQMTACVLRSFLRFLHVRQIVAADLAGAVPAVSHRRLSGLPQTLSPAEVDALLNACDRSAPAGARDFAVITILHRLGLRCAEVASLRVDEVDWQAGTLTVHGKGNRTDLMPLPVDVGQALVDYLRHGRGPTAARTVFVRAVAPHTALASSSVSCIVARAARRAGLGTIHAHRLRHTAASRTLNAGASMEEVSHLLRHASPATTGIYAKTDQSRLAMLARPWPTTGGAS